MLTSLLSLLPIISIGLLQAWQVPILVAEAELQEKVVLSGLVEPLESDLVKVKWFSLVKRVAVNVGQTVKTGDLLAEIEMKYLEYQSSYLMGREKFLERHLKQTIIDEKWLNSQQARLRGLAEKSIVSNAEAEAFTIKTIDAKLRRMRAEKELKDVGKAIHDTANQISNANYHSPMDGVITELVVNPKQLVGSFMAMPNSKLARIDKPGKYVVRATADDLQVSLLKVGQSCQITSDGSQDIYSGKVTQIMDASELKKQGQHLFVVTVVFEQPGMILNRGILARLEFSTSPLKKSVVLPWSAINLFPDKATVLVNGDDGIRSERVVTLGTRGPYRVGIKSGLRAGESVNATLW